MKASELIKGQIYVDITDKKIPLMFMGKIEKSVNIGWNAYVDVVEFKTVRNEINKNYSFPDTMNISFSCDDDFKDSINDRIIFQK